MARLIRIDDVAPDQHPPGLADLLPVGVGDIGRASPDARWVAVDPRGAAAAHCSLWWNDVPPYGTERLGVVGHYAARDAASAAALLHESTGELAARGRTLAVGPMDGNTWRRYRFITDRGEEPTFFLEPDNPDDYPRQWADAGFVPLAGYISSLADRLEFDEARLEGTARRVAADGIRVRPIDLARFEDELRRIYRVSEVGFRGNFLYTPIAEGEFVQQYVKVAPVLKPALVQVAEDDGGAAVGFVFAPPDVNQARAGGTVDTVLIKSLAVLPGRRCAGLGGLLMFRAYQAARDLGYRRAIHALMHDDNVSRNLNRGHMRTIRRYTLFAKRLAATP